MDDRAASVTNSPWFWFFVFGATALVAAAVIAPKHARRQERLDRMADQRARQQFVEEPEATVTAEENDSSSSSVRPLMLFLAAGLAFGAAGVAIHRRRQS
jgi:hypothetical protein